MCVIARSFSSRHEILSVEFVYTTDTLALSNALLFMFEWRRGWELVADLSKQKKKYKKYINARENQRARESEITMITIAYQFS